MFCSPRSGCLRSSITLCVCACASVILARRRRALESESHIKKGGECGSRGGAGGVFRHWRRASSKQHTIAQCQSSSLVLTAHGHPMATFKQGGSWMSISLAGPHSRKVRIHGKGGANHKSPAIEQVGAERECRSGGTDRWSKAAGAELGSS